MRRLWLLIGLLAASACGAAAGADERGRTPRPVIESARSGSQCVEPPAYMRRNHMELLKHQRDDTVRGGIRGARYGLKECIDCHANQTTRSVAQTETNFCVSCHSFAAVKIDCFDCHTPQARAVAGKGAP